MSQSKVQEYFRWITPAALTMLTTAVIWAATKINDIPVIQERQGLVYSKYVPLVDKHETEIEVLKEKVAPLQGDIKEILKILRERK